MAREGALWIGGLEPYMDESFLRRALHIMGEDTVVSVKVMMNRITGDTANYGFINYDNDYSALLAMHKLNHKIIPSSNPPVRFKLNHNSTRLLPGEKNHSIYVGDLTPEVDDLQFYKFFAARFQTVISARVVYDSSNVSKGSGFVRFGSEQELQKALATMTNAVGLGGKPIRVFQATIKSKGSEFEHTPAAPAVADPDYTQAWQTYNQYWAQMAAYNASKQYYDSAAYVATSSESYNLTPEPKSHVPSIPPPPPISKHQVEAGKKNILQGSITELVDHTSKLDYDLLNKQYISRSEELWEAIEASRWWASSKNFQF